MLFHITLGFTLVGIVFSLTAAARQEACTLSIAFPVEPLEQERRSNAEDCKEYSDQECRLIGAETAIHRLHGTGTQQARQGKTDKHDAIIDRVVFTAELAGSEPGENPHKRTKANADDTDASDKSDVGAHTAGKQKHKSNNGKQQRGN